MSKVTREPLAAPRTRPAAFTLVKGLGPFVLAGLILLIPRPEAVQAHGWALFAIFAGTIVGLILRPLPLGAVALIGLTATMLSKTLEPDVALSGFGNATIWLIVCAFFIAKGFAVTGLGTRIALVFVRMLGRRSLGLGYGMALTDLVLAPATPSNTARAGGVLFPIVRSLSSLSGSERDGETRRRVGAYLTMSAFHVNAVTSAMFATAMANPVIQELAGKQGVNLSWAKWALAAVVLGAVSLIVVPKCVRHANSELSNYATGPGPVLFGAGYVTLGEWWRIGALMSVVNIVIWMLVGGLWFKVLGYW